MRVRIPPLPPNLPGRPLRSRRQSEKLDKHVRLVPLAPGARVERACPAFRTGALTATASLANLVEEEGFEPSLAGCRPAVRPFERLPLNWLRAGEVNVTRVAYYAS